MDGWTGRTRNKQNDRLGWMGAGLGLDRAIDEGTDG